MFGYRHAFHAGNFADVLKHVVLVALLQRLQQKPTPLCVLDTHAGIGRYDLRSPEALKNAEFEDGIARLYDRPDAPAPVEQYLAAVRALNSAGPLRHYPGSPRLARHFLRPRDRLILTELNRPDHAVLRQEFADDPQVSIHRQDAYQGLKAFLPPKERRGLVLIDPPYELKDEYERLVTGLAAAHGRWPTGVYAVWYPVLTRSLANRLHAAVEASGIRRILRVELCVRPDTERSRLNGSGLLIINPPWQLDAELGETLPWLREQLVQEPPGAWTLDWLVGE